MSKNQRKQKERSILTVKNTLGTWAVWENGEVISKLYDTEKDAKSREAEIRMFRGER